MEMLSGVELPAQSVTADSFHPEILLAGWF
jgi:hypothetical protein